MSQKSEDDGETSSDHKDSFIDESLYFDPHSPERTNENSYESVWLFVLYKLNEFLIFEIEYMCFCDLITVNILTIFTCAIKSIYIMLFILAFVSVT